MNKSFLGVFTWKRLFKSGIIIYLIMTLFVHLIADSIMFPYDQSSYNDDLTGLKFVETESNTKIASRFWKSDNEKYLILYFHGNYLDIGHLDSLAEVLTNKGYSILAMDYRGYGLSEGNAGEKNTMSDSQLIYDLATEMGYTSNEIIIVGRSIGTGVATDLALKKDAKALILISPFVSAYRILTKFPIIPFDKFNNLNKISKISQPLFVVYGNKDKVIKPWHSEVIFENHEGNKKKYTVDGAGHNDIFDFSLEDIINQFEILIENP